jgi:hypothetical protein
VRSWSDYRPHRLPREGDFLQRRDYCWTIARNHQTFEANRISSGQRDIAEWDTNRFGYKADEGSVSLALGRHSANMRFEDGAPVRQLANAID